MSPAVPGQWRWETGSVLRFTPDTSLKPGTQYTVNLAGLALPPRIKLSGPTVWYTTQPQAVCVGKETFWTDPSPKAAHAVSIPLEFIWPVNPSAIEKAITVKAESAASGLTFGQPRFIWSEAHDRVTVTLPVTGLPKAKARGVISIAGIPAFHWDNAKRVIDPAAKGKQARTTAAFPVASTSTLMAVKSATLRRDHDASLNSRCVLEIQTSLYVKPSELAASLDLIELPKFAQPGASAPTNWTAMPALSAADIQGGKAIAPKLISVDEPTDRVLLSVPADAGRYVMVAVKDQLKSTGGFKLPRVSRSVLQVPEIPAGISFLQTGNILPLAGEKKIALYSAGIDRIVWKARRVRTPFLALLAHSRGFEQSEDLDLAPLTEVVSGSAAVTRKTQEGAAFTLLDIGALAGKAPASSLISLELEGYRGKDRVAQASRLILATDIGLIVKSEAGGTQRVYVQRISSGEPVAGASVQMLAANGKVIREAASAADGSVRLDALSVEGSPAAAICAAAKGTGGADSFAWLSLSDSQRRLDMSSFATAGRHTSDGGLNLSVFAERGIFMPGEELNFGFIARRFDWKPLPKDLPLEAVVTDPQGRTVMKRVVKLAADGLEHISWKSPESAPTGTYRLDVRVPQAGADGSGEVLGSATVRVEEFEPDTMALKAELTSAHKGWIRTSEAQAIAAKLDTLYGTSAADHRMGASINLEPARLAFKEFPDYKFCDATAQVEPRTITLPDAYTDKNGSARISMPLTSIAGTAAATFSVEGFEASGGRAVGRRIRALVSPLAVAVGFKSTSNLDFLEAGKPARVSFIGVTNTLSPADLKGVKVTQSNRRYVNALVTDTRGEYRYDSVPVDSPISTKQADFASGALEVDLNTSKPGDYLLTLTGADGVTLATVPYTVAGSTAIVPEGSAAPASAALRLALSKETYEPGEEIAVRVTAPYAGSGLITVERDTVAASLWFKAPAGESVQKIRLPKDFIGRGFVTVSFARSQASDAVYLQPHVYATVPFAAGIAQRDMGIKLKAPETILPGAELRIHVDAAKPGRVALIAVDEGVLQLTRHRTPDPLHDLLADRALDVATMQTNDLLMPDFARLRGRIPGFGGGAADMGGRFDNPFRRRSEPPFAKWLGILDVPAGGKDVSVKVPAYMAGKIRLMAVGSSASGQALAAGSAQRSVRVAGSLIIRPMLPLASTPGDEFFGAVSVSNTIKGSGAALPVKLSIKPAAGFAFIGMGSDHELKVDENGEAVVPIHMKVQGELGPNGITFTASSAKLAKPVVRSQEISVRPPSAKLHTQSSGSLKGPADMADERDLYAFGADRMLTVGPEAVLALSSAARHLAAYPYGCTEQRISRAFPYAATLRKGELRSLVLPAYSSEKAKQEKAAEEAIASALAAIRANASYGGVALWQGAEPNDFLTAYAADFLLTLRESGRGVPDDLAGEILSAAERLATREPTSLEGVRTMAYATWVLLRDGRVMTQNVERLESWLKANTDANAWKKDIAATLLADCYAKLRLERKGRRLMPASISLEGYSDNSLFSAKSAAALAGSIRAAAPWSDRGAEATERVATSALDPNATTVEQALASRGLAALAAKSAAGEAVELSCSQPADAGGAKAESGLVARLRAPACLRFHAEPKGASEAPLVWLLESDGYDRKVQKAYAQGIEVKRRYLTASGEAVSQVRTGDVLTVELTVRADHATDNVVVVDLLPGGLEPVIERAGSEPTGEGLVRFERHEDRGIFFVSADTRARTFRYRVRAMTAGKFVLPSASASAMYAPDVSAATAGGSFTVTK